MIDSGPNPEFITFKLDFGSKQTRVALGYGPQEKCFDKGIGELVLYSGRNAVDQNVFKW